MREVVVLKYWMGREELGKVLLGRGWTTLKEAMTSGRPDQSRHEGEKPGRKRTPRT